MPDLELTAAFGDYDRTNILKVGAVRPQGVNLRVLSLPPTEIFFRIVQIPGVRFIRNVDGSAHVPTRSGRQPLRGDARLPEPRIPAFDGVCERGYGRR